MNLMKATWNITIYSVPKEKIHIENIVCNFQILLLKFHAVHFFFT